MALAYSNLTGSSASPASLSTLNLSNIGKPAVAGVTNTNVVPTNLQATTIKTPVSAPATTPASTGAKVVGTYQGQQIYAGTDAEIAAQMAKIDGAKTAAPAASLVSPALSTPAATGTTSPVPTTPTYSGLVGNLVMLGNEGSKEYARANKALTDLRISAADKKAGIYSAPTSAKVMQGREAAVQQANAEKEAALAAGVTNALQEQNQQITALNAAAGYTQPVQIAPGSTLTSPMTGETVAGGLGGYANYQTAQQVMSLISQYPDAGYVYDQTKTPQENLQTFQTEALQRSPTYQKSTYGAPGATNVAGGTVTQTAQAGYQQSYQQYQTMSTQLQNADGQADLLLKSLTSSGINSGDARFANKTINEVRRQLSSSDLQVFDSALKETQAAYGQLLVATGGTTPTGAEDAYNTILNPNSSLSAFEAAINQLKAAGRTKVNAQADQVNNYLQTLNSAQPTTGGGQGGSVQAGGFNFVQDASGKWVPS